MLGAADGAAVDTMRAAVVDATPAESVAVALGGAEAVLVVAMGGAGVDAVGTSVVVVWPKAIPERRKTSLGAKYCYPFNRAFPFGLCQLLNLCILV